MQLTDQTLETSRILATRMVPEHIDDVTTVLKDTVPILRMLGENLDIDRQAWRMVAHTDTPPGGLVENNRNYLLRTHSGGLIGVLCSCLYFPDKRSSYIGSLFLRPAYRRQGIGVEIVQSWYSILYDKGITEARVCVGLKNWPALRFWLSAGYDRVTTISGDQNHADDQFASIELSRCVALTVV